MMSQVQEEKDQPCDLLSSTAEEFEIPPHQYGQTKLQQMKVATENEISQKAGSNIMVALAVLMVIQVVVLAAACIAFALELSNLEEKTISTCQDSCSNFTDLVIRLENLDDSVNALSAHLASASIHQDSCSNLTGLVTRLDKLDDSIDAVSTQLFHNVSMIDDQLQLLNSSFINSLATQTQQLLYSLVDLGTLPTVPANSCATLPPSTPSGYYWIRNASGSSVYIYCDMDRLWCGVIGGWTRVAYLNMGDSSNQCPNGLSERNYSVFRTCVNSYSSIGCSSGTIFPALYSYSEVCGYVVGYQKGRTDAFAQQLDDIDSFYVDGVSLTHGSPRQHIWTFAAARDETQEANLESKCPCILNNDTNFLNRPPSFVGDDYFCDTGIHNSSNTDDIFYSDKPLWVGVGCGPISTCCTYDNPPFFYKQLSQPTTDDIEVFSFLRGVLTHLIPAPLWGSSHNCYTFFSHLKKFVDLRRWETMSVEMITQNIKLSYCDWLKCPSSSQHGRPHPPQPHLFHRFLHWLMEEVIIKVIKSFFYVTEHQEHRNHVFYFRKRVWSCIQKITLKFQEEEIFAPISVEEVEMLIQQEKTMGVSKLRFLPKSNKVRPIVNLGSKVQLPSTCCGRGRKAESVNKQLQDVFHVLNYEKARNPSLCGSTCFGYHHVHERLKKFVLKQRRLSPELEGPYFFAHFDLCSCYDSMLPQKLLDILKERVLSKEQYVMRRYATVFISHGKLRRSFCKVATTSRECSSFFKFAMELSKKSRNMIFVDQVAYPSISRGKVCQLLKNHLFGNIVKLCGKYFKQVQGIPQGSKLSTMLCGFYYADMERTSLPRVSSKTSLLLRFVDDFLLVTCDRALAVAFTHSLHEGVQAYNCTVNREKGRANFTIDGSGQLILDHNVQWMEWCGLLVNVKNMDIRVSYSRYAMSNIRDNVTIVLHSSPLKGLLYFMQRSIKLRCLPVLLDCELVTEKNVLINIYQAFLLAGVKYLAYGTDNSLFAIPSSLCVWLGCHAFKTVLTHHQPKRLSLLIQILRCKMDTLANALGPDLLKRCFRATRQVNSMDILTLTL